MELRIRVGVWANQEFMYNKRGPLTILLHALSEALIISAELTAISLPFVDYTVSLISAGV